MFAPPDDDTWARGQASWDSCDSLAAWDGDRCVGHVGGYRIDALVPGGAYVPTSAVTRVGILPTHRRRGLASRLMARLLDEAAARGQVMATLRASETVIYGRFGFGLGGWAAEVKIDAARARPLKGGATGGSFRLLARDEIIPTVRTIYDAHPGRPGVLRRPDWMWERYFYEATKDESTHHVVVHRNADGLDDGYAHYSLKWQEVPFEMTGGEGDLHELVAASPSTELALWGFLFDIDLVRTWTASERPVDDAVRVACHDIRAYDPKLVWDEQWVRILDVDAALGARTYQPTGDSSTVSVTDTHFEANTGVWHIGAHGAKRIDEGEPADLTVDVRVLGALYLGGVTWRQLADVGEVGATSDEAVRRADSLFRVERAPFCGSFF